MSLNITQFHAVILKAPVVNQQWSWGSINPSKTAIFLRCWQHESKRINGIMHMMIDAGKHSKDYLGDAERKRHIDEMRSGVRTYAVSIRKAQDSWKIESYIPDRLFRLGTNFVEIDGDLYAPIIDVVTPTQIASNPPALRDDN
jgi:hypothetical protein